MIAYDRRKGWRGPILNLEVEDKWFNKIKKKDKLEKSINWQLAIIKNVNQFNADIETEKK